MFSLRRLALRTAAARPAAARIAVPELRAAQLLVRAFSDAPEGLPSFRRTGGAGGNFQSNDSQAPRERRERPPAPTTPTKVLYVGNVSFQATEEDLMEVFSQVGTVESVKLARHATDGNPRGWAYVEVKDLETAAAAVDALNGASVHGRQLIVQYVNRRTLRINPPSKILFLGNLPFQMTDDDLVELFKDVKGCLDVRIAVDRRTNQPRGFAHADFVSIEAAEEAKRLLTGTQAYGRWIRVDFSEGMTRADQLAAKQQKEQQVSGEEYAPQGEKQEQN